uniref:hypothetical protein n=1 Tax=Streptomyces sp. TG1A-60 TaxID=3129111 RepID=UPI00403FFCD2
MAGMSGGVSAGGGAGPRRSKLGWNLLGPLVFVTAGFPVYWMLNTAFKPAEDAIDPDPGLLPTTSPPNTAPNTPR